MDMQLNIEEHTATDVWPSFTVKVSDFRKAFADQDKMHFDVLIDRMLADAGCA